MERNRIVRRLFSLLMLAGLAMLAAVRPAAALHERTALPAAPLAQPQEIASYRINVQLDPVAKTVSGTERITYRNPSQDTLDELYLRLYLKAFSSLDTLWMRESGGQLRGDQVSPNELGDISVQSLRATDGTNLLAAATLTDTLLRVPLTTPLGPGAAIEMDAQWTSKLPRVFARTGYGGRDDTFFMVGQWYPKMAVYDRGQWDTEPWHANSEFFHDFGNYDVSITVPQAYVVAGAGVPAGEQAGANGTKTVRFTADNVTDFAFAASPDFLVQTARSGATDIAVYYLPEHAAAAPIYTDTAVRSLQTFGAWFGAYPWPRLSVIDVPNNASGAGGMEYPTLVTGGLEGLPANSGFVQYVTAHEIGHQWWPMQTATNEGREPWLDEGLTEYTGMRYIIETDTRIGFGPASISAAAFERSSATLASSAPVDLPAWEYSGADYGAITYNKTALGLWTLEDAVGADRFRAAMAAYLQQYRFKHPTGADFRASLEASLGELGWFFDDFIGNGGAIDYAVQAINNTPEASRVTIERVGDVAAPVDVAITLRSGRQQIETWAGEEPTTTFEFSAADPAVHVVIDPDQKLHAELNVRDNQSSTQVQVAPALTLGARLTFWAQFVAQFFGLFG